MPSFEKWLILSALIGFLVISSMIVSAHANGGNSLFSRFLKRARLHLALLLLLLLPIGLIEFSHADEHVLTVLAPDLPGASEEGGKGRDLEIISEVLALCGYSLKVTHQPYGRHLETFRQIPTYDAVMTVPLGTDLPGFSTPAYIWYQNGAFYDSTRVAPIHSVRDLSGLNMVTFKDGISLLDLEGGQFKTESILEIADQERHSKLLMLHRVDVILADGLVVATSNRNLSRNDPDFRSLADNPNFRFSPIFLPSPFKAVFRKKDHADQFEECFERAARDDVIYDINSRYLLPLKNEIRFRYLGY